MSLWNSLDSLSSFKNSIKSLRQTKKTKQKKKTNKKKNKKKNKQKKNPKKNKKKKTPKNNNSKVPSYFLNSDRYLSVQHARIRNNYSNLKAIYIIIISAQAPFAFATLQLKMQHITIFPLSEFAESRLVLFQAFHPLNMDKLRFGDASINNHQNSILFFPPYSILLKDQEDSLTTYKK